MAPLSKSDMNKFDGLIHQVGLPKWNTISLSMELLMTYKTKSGGLIFGFKMLAMVEWYKKSYGGYIAWTQFVKVIYAHFE
jgi:hypothetical protein